MIYDILPTKIYRNSSSSLIYSSDLPLKKGQIVLIPLGRKPHEKIIPGIVLGKSKEKSVSFTVKSVKSLICDSPLPSHLLKSIRWLSSYYLLEMPLVASLFLPEGIEKSRRKLKLPEKNSLKKIKNIPLSPAQKTALDELKSIKVSTRLLHGITGSGKTNIYLSLTAETLEKNQSVILLVPEISLTSQLVQVFESTFSGRITLIHSKQTESERHQIWEKLLKSEVPEIVIGPRSALFAPLKNLGLIIIDESHESAYYQENSPKYSALRLASFISKTLNIPCIQGTATPLVSDYYLAKKNSALVTLDKKAKDTAIAPKIDLIDLKNRENFTKNRYFSDCLISSMKENLKNGYQTLIFHNRRGSSPLTICESCGWQAFCPSCFVPLTLHSDSYKLICHICGHEEPIPHSCPNCHSVDIIHKGFGTKLLESELKKLLPAETRIARFDADSKKSESLFTLYDSVKSGEINVIIGTQTIAKGLDLPLLATVGIVQADSGLSLPDFSSEEKTFHLLTQVIGRVGRGHIDRANVIVQTYQPTHPAIRYALASDYNSFEKVLLENRKKQKFPPYFFLSKVSVTMKTELLALKKIREVHSFLTNYSKIDSNSLETKTAPSESALTPDTKSVLNASSSANVSLAYCGDEVCFTPPTPVFHERSTAGFSWQIILRARSRARLQETLKSLEKTFPTIKIVIDPPSLL